MKTLTIAASAALILILSGCGGGGASGSASPGSHTAPSAASSSSEVAKAPGIAPQADEFGYLGGTVEPERLVSSAITGIDYPINVYLPSGYAQTTRDYPIVYALDGQVMFPGLPYLLEDEGVAAILVAISEGPKGRRKSDYLLPGARDYFAFLTSELMPLIESEYRVNPDNRSLVGTSFGGVFVAEALLMDDVADPLFANYMAFDASFYRHPQLTETLLRDRYLASGTLNAKLFLSSAMPAGNDEYVDDFQTSLQARQFNGLSITRQQYQTTHAQVAEPSFREAAPLLINPH